MTQLICESWFWFNLFWYQCAATDTRKNWRKAWTFCTKRFSKKEGNTVRYLGFWNCEKWAYGCLIENNLHLFRLYVRFPHLISLTFLGEKTQEISHLSHFRPNFSSLTYNNYILSWDVPKVFIDFEASFSNQVLDDGIGGSVGEKPNVHQWHH